MKRAILLLLVCHYCLAGTTDDRISDSAYVEYGKKFASYTKPFRVVEDSGRVTASTAVVIAPRFALTAAHVVQDFDTGSIGSNPATGVFMHDDYEENTFGVNDIAVVRCRDDFGLDYYPLLSDGTELEGDKVVIAGYGINGPLSTGFSESDGKLRAGTNTIDHFERSMIVCVAQRSSSPMEFCISPGDSGGPLFVGSGSSARLAGINSCTMAEVGRGLRSCDGEESGHTRVALFREWIEKVLSCGDE